MILTERADDGVPLLIASGKLTGICASLGPTSDGYAVPIEPLIDMMETDGGNMGSFTDPATPVDPADDPTPRLLAIVDHLAEFGFSPQSHDHYTGLEILARNLTAMQQMGVQTDGFDKQAYTDMVVNPPHIPELLKAHGYAAYFPMTTFDLDLSQAVVTDRSLDARFRF